MTNSTEISVFLFRKGGRLGLALRSILPRSPLWGGFDLAHVLSRLRNQQKEGAETPRQNAEMRDRTKVCEEEMIRDT